MDIAGVAKTLERAVADFRGGQTGKAKALLEDVLRHHPGNAEAMHLLGLITHHENDPVRAVALLEKAVATNAEVASFHGDLGEVYRTLGRPKDAILCCRRALALNPNYPQALNSLGIALYQSGETAEAEASLREALRLDPEFAGAHVNLGRLLEAQGKLDDAGEAYRRAIRCNPNMAAAQVALGGVHRASRRPDEAVACYRAALALNPEAGDVWLRLADTYYETEHFDEALTCCEKAFALSPGAAMVSVSLGRILLRLNRAEEALEAFGRAVTLNPELPEAYLGKGIACDRLARVAEGEAAYRRALSLRPMFPDAQNNLASTLLKQGRLQEAQAEIGRLVETVHGKVVTHADDLPPPDPRAQLGKRRPPRIARFLLLDRMAQLQRLLDRRLIDPSFERILERFASVASEFPDVDGPESAKPLTPDQLARLDGVLNRILYCADAPRLAGPAVNEDQDFKAIEAAYLSADVPAVSIDDILTPDALAALRTFCLDSTIFFESNTAGYVQSYLANGFNCSLMYQISEELKRHFPRILGPHFLSNMWAYRHVMSGHGVAPHSDYAAVTFNFWITPDEANLDPKSGGLVIYDKEQPLDWDWTVINRRKNQPEVQQRIGSYLASAGETLFPYRANRAVMFRSNLFHGSDVFRFKDGLENRRTNISLLFGYSDVHPATARAAAGAAP
jgi:tetratricopeptide (TPR) repeat protein